MKKSALIIAIMASMISWAKASPAQEVPHYVNFQAVLRDDSGNLIEDGFVDLTIKILDQDKDEMYAEVQPGVQVVRSAINVMVGEGTVPGSSPSAPTGGIPPASLDPNLGSHFLQIQFGSNLPSDPMELGSVPYAMYAENALSLVGDIPVSQIPDDITRDSELVAAIAAHENDTTAHPASSITAVDNFQNIAGTNVQTVLENLDAAIETEESARASGDSSLQSQINGKVNRSGDTMSGTLNMGGNNVTNAGNFVTSGNVNLLDHETRIDALEGAPPPVTFDGYVFWHLGIDSALGGQKSGSDSGDWNLSGVATADSRWNVLTRNVITVSSGCTPLATGNISPDVVVGDMSSLDWDDIAYLRITYSGQQVNIIAYSMGNDGRYNINYRVTAIPGSSGSCTITP